VSPVLSVPATALFGLAVVLLPSACSRGGSSTVTSSPAASPTGTGTPSPTVTSDSSATAAPTDGGSPTAASASVTADGALPGAPFTWLPAGRHAAVVGVRAGTTLPLRTAPGPTRAAVTALTPLTTGLVTTGRARRLGTGAGVSVWGEVTYRALRGWLPLGNVGLPADAVDETAETITRLGRTPTATTMLDLGTAVAHAWTSTEPPSTITVSVAPTAGDLGEITLDVVGLGDDSVAAQRLHVFGTPGTGSFTLKSVEATPFCSRGVTAGRCT
jgi:hypothetical protein